MMCYLLQIYKLNLKTMCYLLQIFKWNLKMMSYLLKSFVYKSLNDRRLSNSAVPGNNNGALCLTRELHVRHFNVSMFSGNFFAKKNKKNCKTGRNKLLLLFLCFTDDVHSFLFSLLKTRILSHLLFCQKT